MTLLNPTVIVEILSASTEAYDRGRKFEQHYQSIYSLHEYLLIASDRIGATLFRRRSEDEWLSITVKTLDGSIKLESAGCTLSLKDLYEGVEFAAAEQA
jgi:Uma2 family endonuclease